MNKSNFIITQDENTKTLLINTGLELISDSNGSYTFLNCINKMKNFESNNDLKFTYSNKMLF
ncbi:hypothetical protein [Clostridium sp.]|uniref:hypothetical protein n=1 Tax=Clostridium sp. TaxID=1506 RepID=UPI003216C743